MQETTIKLGMVKELDPKYRFWYLVGVVGFVLFVLFTIYKEDDLLAVIIFLLQIPLVIILSLPSLFPEKELFQLFVKFTDSQISYKKNFLKSPIVINYSDIETIEIKPTKVIVVAKEQPIEFSFNMTGYKRTKEIKTNFETLKEELNR
jgi:hypothetical protein